MCARPKRDWTDHKPARSAANRFIQEHGFAAFGKWYLGEDDEQAEHSRQRYKFPLGDFRMIHRCSCPQNRVPANTDIRRSSWRAAHLREMLDALMSGKRSSDLNHVSSA